ncbi:hypothetical protein Gorai_000250, partial [Gossypium raimondii]|nr:hypothetical protein [Gossypium raimondii]
SYSSGPTTGPSVGCYTNN